MNAKETSEVGIKYSVRDPFCDVIIYCARSCDMSKVSENDKIVIQNVRKNEKMA